MVWRADFPKNRLYWLVAPQVHRFKRYRSQAYVSPPIDPFEVTSVDPDRIVRFTHREYPAWLDAWECFGATVSGDWDVREDIPVDQSYAGTDPDLYVSDRFTGSVLHRSLDAHFTRDVPWDETPFIKEVLHRIGADRYGGHHWTGCSTASDVWKTCERVDRLYESIRDRGCLSMRRLNAERGYPDPFRPVMENEILVDVGRDRELLFVDGRHRLSIAKILGLDTVPVAKVVRHEAFVKGD